MLEKKIVISYDYNDVPTVRAFTRDTAEVKAIIGPFGSGKSSGCVMDLLNKSFAQRPNKQGIRKTRWSIVRNSYLQLKDTTKKTVEEWLPFAKWREYDHLFTINVKAEDGTTVYSEWMLRALDRPDQVTNLLSLEITGAWMNEAREIPKPIFEALQGRVGRYPRRKEAEATWSGIIMDTNPPDFDNWFYKYFEETPMLKCFKCRDNQGSPMIFEIKTGCPVCKSKVGVPYNVIYKQPSGLSQEAENLSNLKAGYYTNLMVGKDENYIKAYIHGEYAYFREGMPVFSSYKDSVHLFKEEIKPIDGLGIVIGFDCTGLSPSAVFTQLDQRGRLLILDELYVEDMCFDIREFVTSLIKPLLLTKYRHFPYTLIGDPAGKQRSQIDKRTVFMEMKAQGLKNIKAASTNFLQPRLSAVNKFLNMYIGGSPAFNLSPNCKQLRKAFLGEYKLRKLKLSGERYSEFPEKNSSSHLMDALQYACLGYDTVFGAGKALEGNIIGRGVEQEVLSDAWT